MAPPEVPETRWCTAAIDEASRLASVDALASEQKTKAAGVLIPAIGWVSEQGISCRRGSLKTTAPLTAQGIGEQPVRHWL